MGNTVGAMKTKILNKHVIIFAILNKNSNRKKLLGTPS